MFYQREIDLRKEELRLREKEAATKAKEIEMLRETKEKENEIARMKAEAEIEDKKKITDLLIKLATEKRQWICEIEVGSIKLSILPNN